MLKYLTKISYLFIHIVYIVSSIFIFCQLSSFLPKRFNEELVRVYYKRSDDQADENKKEEKKNVEEAEKCFQMWCDSNFGLKYAAK